MLLTASKFLLAKIEWHFGRKYKEWSYSLGWNGKMILIQALQTCQEQLCFWVLGDVTWLSGPAADSFKWNFSGQLLHWDIAEVQDPDLSLTKAITTAAKTNWRPELHFTHQNIFWHTYITVVGNSQVFFHENRFYLSKQMVAFTNCLQMNKII